MFESMQAWLNEYKPDECEVILSSLTKEAVREGRNKRIGSLANSTEETFSTLSLESDGYGSTSALDESGVSHDPETALQDDLDSLAVDLSDRDRILPSTSNGRRRPVESDSMQQGKHRYKHYEQGRKTS